jgi:glycosyltransferase involved in cell wall biosynthesis
MRILKISDVYFPRVNGVSTSIRTFAREFRSLGHPVTLIAPAYPSEHKEDFDILRIPSRYLPVDPEDRIMQPRAIKRLLEPLREQSFDVIHIHTPFIAHYLGLWLARRLQVPTVETYHTYFEEYLDKYVSWLPRRTLRLAARRFSVSQCRAVDALVVPTLPMAEVLQRYGVTAAPHVIPTGIPTDAFVAGDGARFRARHRIPAARPVLLYVGRVAHEKNIDFLLKAHQAVVRARPDALLVIAGEGPARRSLEDFVKRHALAEHVRFVGYLDRRSDLPDCYAAADAFVFASRTETQGLVLLEAMKLGIPVISTAVMGTAEIMRDRRGGLVAEETVPDFSSKTLRLLGDPELRAQLGLEASKKAEEWSAPATAQRMLGLYDELSATRRA